MTSTQNSLARGAHGKRPESLPSLFLSTTVPVIHKNSIIVAALEPPIPTSKRLTLTRMVLGAEQTWITAADPQKLVEKYGPYLHGNPYEDRKECLSQH
ncbi:hypothetical protein N7454_002582 [Penicillium verhagenii]|nr:hypothetical protein N7454_002582 [Penicillium verhagenii]